MRNPVDNLIWEKYPSGSVTQWFGENPPLYAFLDLAGHNGIDIVKPYGTPIYAVTDQKIVDVKHNPKGYGRHIRAIGQDKEYVYGHLSKIEVTLGQEVKEGDKIGEMGNSGFVVSGSTPFWKYNPYAGTHLHFGIRETSDVETGWANIYRSGDLKYIKNYNNSYKGAVDPMKFFNHVPQDVDQIKALQMTVISLLREVVKLYTKLLAMYNK